MFQVSCGIAEDTSLGKLGEQLMLNMLAKLKYK